MNYRVLLAGYHTKSHRNKKNPNKKCEDYHFITNNEYEKNCTVSVADGAGSSEFAELGAKIVCEKICFLLQKKFNEYYESDPFVVKRKIIHILRTTLGKKAKEKNSTIDEFASTLLFLAIKDNRIIAGHIGDGMIVYEKNHALEILSPPENGEFANLTYFVTSKYYLHHLRLYKGELGNIESFYLLTDGIANLFFSKRNKTLLNSFESIVKGLNKSTTSDLFSSIRSLLDDNISKRTEDDSTLLAVFIDREKA